MKIKDHSISKEMFNLVYDNNLNLFQTSPLPVNLSQYYISNDYISHTDSARNWFEKLYQIVKKRALQNKLQLILNYSKNPKVLDFGCGTGDFVKYINAKNINGVGVEPNFSAREIANNKNISVFEDLNEIQNQKFDVITLWHVLEHVPDYQNQILELKKLLSPNGFLIIAVPNFNSYDAKHYQNFWAGYDVPRHIWHFSKSSIYALASQFNLKLLSIKPMWLDSFYVSLLSEKYKNGSQNILKALFIGLLSNINGLKTKEFSSHIYILQSNE